MENLICDHCSRIFDNKTSFALHYRWHNGKMQRKVFSSKRQCKICKETKPLGEFRSIYRKIQQRKYYFYTCKKCQSKQTYEYTKKHKKWSKEVNYKCYRQWKLRTIGNKCQICGENRTLDVSHIVPRQGKSRSKMRIEPSDNLLGLCPTHHRLFDENKLTEDEYRKIKEKVELAKKKYGMANF